MFHIFAYKEKTVNNFGINFKVKCVVCKRIFCCSKCRQKHETDTHGINEITAKNNYEKCSLCKGYPTLRLELINDFDFITHLCHHHVPLHCKKCSKVNNDLSQLIKANVIKQSLFSFLRNSTVQVIFKMLSNALIQIKFVD